MPDSWQRITLGEVATQHIDGFGVASDVEYTNLGVQWYAGGTFARSPKRGSEMKASRLFRVRPGQFVYNRMFVTEGAFALVADDHGNGVVSNEFPVFDLDESRIEPAFLLAHFRQPSVWRTVADEATGTTKSRRRWKESQFLDHAIVLPPLEEQQRILDLLTAVDKAAAAADAEAACSRFAWRATARAGTAGSTEFSLGDLVSNAKAGGTPSRSDSSNYVGTIPWLKSGEVHGRDISDTEERVSEAALSQSSAWLVPAGSVLVAMYGATAGQVGLTSAPMSTNQAVLALVANQRIVSPQLLFHLVSASADELKAKAVGAAQPNISKQIVVAHRVHVPPRESHVAFEEALTALLDAADTASATAEALRAVRSNLLTVLLSGEHEIPASCDHFLEVVPA